MGIDAQLMTNAKYSADDIKDIIESMPEVSNFKVQVNDWATSYVIFRFKFNDEDRQMNIHFHSDGYGLPCTLCTLGQWGSANYILTKIGKILGGFFTENDCEGKYEMFQGLLNEEDGLPYFLKEALIKSKMTDNDDIDGLISYIKEWKEIHN